MDKIIDTRGLSCPQPVMMTMDEISALGKGTVAVLVDTDTARENVTALAQRFGWQVADVQPDGVGYKMTITKS
jgi:tRNA 2-thiouridine synthesizing protein A